MPIMEGTCSNETWKEICLKAGCVKSSNDIRIKSNSNKGYRIQKTLHQSGHTKYSAYVFTKQKAMQHNN